MSEDKGCSCGEHKGCGRCKTATKLDIPCFICKKPKGQTPDKCPGHYLIDEEWIDAMYGKETVQPNVPISPDCIGLTKQDYNKWLGRMPYKPK